MRADPADSSLAGSAFRLCLLSQVQVSVFWSVVPSARWKSTLTVCGLMPLLEGVTVVIEPLGGCGEMGTMVFGNAVVLPGAANHSNVTLRSLARCQLVVVLAPTAQVTV